MSIAHFAANAAAPRLTATLVGGFFASFGIGPGSVATMYRLTTVNEQYQEHLGSITTLVQWIPNGADPADFQVNFNPSGDTAQLSGAGFGPSTWLALSAVRAWTITATGGPGSFVNWQVTGDVKIRNASTLEVLATASVTLGATLEP